MPTQMQRKTGYEVADWLLQAAHAEHLTLQSMVNAYKAARGSFTFSENEPDPETIALGLQACALGVRTLCQWLTAVSDITEDRYHNHGVTLWSDTDTIMQGLGLVIPDHYPM